MPRWLGEELIFVSDRTDWWNLYLWSNGSIRALHELDAEFCLPQWQLGQTPYTVLDHDQLLCTVNRGGEQSLAVLRVSSGELTPVPGPQVAVYSLAGGSGVAAAILGHPDRPMTLSLLDLARLTWTEVRSSSRLTIDPGSISRARAVSWAGPQGDVHGWYYPPANAAYTAPVDTLPMLITLSHGGPTACASPDFKIGYQFWTTRGFAILDVNYGGSTGYGRAYRDRLIDNWGIVDVRDCAAGAVAMGEQGLADPRRLVIRGGSAGGYTTLCALTGTDVFAAGISLYGVGDLEVLATDTHKFESRYLDKLIGPYPTDPSPLRRAVADPPRRSALVADLAAAGHRGQGRTTEPGLDDGRGRAIQGAPGVHDHVRGRGPRLPAHRFDQGRRQRPSSTSWAGSSASSRPTTFRRSRSTTWADLRRRRPVVVGWQPGAEDRLADSYRGRAVLDGQFEIPGHPHRELVDAARQTKITKLEPEGPASAGNRRGRLLDHH